MNAMNHINRLIVIVLALLLIAAPVALLLIILGVLPASALQGAVGSLGSIPGAITVAGPIIGIAGVVLALIALVLLLLQLRVKLRGKVKHVYLQRDAGKETWFTANGATSLVEGAAKEAGSLSPKASVKPYKKSYRFSCKIEAPSSVPLTELIAGVRHNIQRVLEYQEVSARSVEVILQGVRETEDDNGAGNSGRGEFGRQAESGTATSYTKTNAQTSERNTATAAS